MNWTRYAIYWTPDGRLGDLGAAWLGWDIRRGRTVNPPVSDQPKARRYGFHATLKPPFRLAEYRAAEDLTEAARAAARTLPPAPIGALAVSRDHGFLALRPELRGPIASAAERLVAGLDDFRAAEDEADLGRRRSADLTPRQERMLFRWGYPHVMDDFHPHLTLSGPAPSDALARDANRHFAEATGVDIAMDTISLVGEDPEGRFHVIEQFRLAHPSAA